MTQPDTTATNSARPGWQLLWTSTLAHKRTILAGVAAAILWTLGRIAVPVLVKLGIDRGIEDDGSLLKWSAYILIAGAIAGAALGARRYLAFAGARIVEARLRDRLFAHIQRLHFAFHDANATGDLLSRANTDLQQFQNIISLIPLLIGNIVMVIGVTIVMVIINPILALLALVSLPFVNILGKRFAQRLFPAVAGIQAESAQLATVVEETVTGIRVVKGFGAEPVRINRLATEADDVYRESMDASLTRSRYLPAMEIMPNLGIITVLGYGGHLVLDGSMSIGDLVSFNIFVLLLIQPLRMLGIAVANGQRSAAAGDRIAEVLSTAPTIDVPAHPKTLVSGSGHGRVEFRNVSFNYQNGLDEAVLEDFNLAIEAGESVALVGATGSGKSTVAKLLPRFYDVDSGQVCLDGLDVRELRPRDLRRAVGLVFEETFLFNATIRENISFANPDAPFHEVQRAAALSGADFIEDLALGYGTTIGERGFSLSGGQRQRLAIARAILADPRVLILDDATSAVDPAKEHEIRDALGEVMDRRTTIVIAHRAATIALADRVVLLDAGRIVAEGTHAQLLESSARYRTVLATSDVEGAH